MNSFPQTSSRFHQVKETDLIDERHPADQIEIEENHTEAAELLRWLLDFLLSPHSIEGISARPLVLANALGFEHPLAESLSSIARHAGISRQAVKEASERVERLAGLRPSTAKKRRKTYERKTPRKSK